MKEINYVFATLTFLVFLGSCKGSAWETGPIGPAGVQGAAGANVAKGDIGTVNIITTGWIEVTKETFTKGYMVEDGVFYTGTVLSGGNLDKITQKVIDKGIVLAYNRVIGAPDIFLVPFDYYDGSLQVTYSLNIQPKKATV